MGLVVSLIIVGMVLLFAEILLIPGVGIAGILGLLSMGGSCFYAFHEFGHLTGGIVTGVNVILLVVMVVYVLRAKTWKRMSLETNIDSKAVADDSGIVCIGDVGRTMTRLAPTGSVRFGDNLVEAKAIEGMLDPGVDVEIVMIEDNKIYVRIIENNR